MESGTNGAGLCWGCDYPLLGIESGRCPECGLAFSASDWRTMNMGRALGRWGRWAILPVGWWVVVAGVVGCAMIWVVTRWPVHAVNEWFVDLRFYLWWGDWRERWAGAGWRDVVYLAGLLLWMLIVVAWWGGGLIRVMMLERLPVGARAPVVRARGRHWLLLLLLLWTVLMVGAGWPCRLGEAMVSRELARLDGRKTDGAFSVVMRIDEAQQQRALWAAALGGGGSRERLTALGLLVENFPNVAPGVIEQMLAEERDAGMKAWELRLLGLHRGVGSVDRVKPFLEDSDGRVRVAAVDALGLMYGGVPGGHVWENWTRWDLPTVTTSSDPPIQVSVEARSRWRYRSGAVAEMPDDIRRRIVAMMLSGASLEEREAASRAASRYRPGDYHLRVAEWGVWLAGSDGGRLESVLSDMPPVVHEFGDSVTSLARPVTPPSRTNLSRRLLRRPMAITKPVIHLTANVPMCVELSVAINRGRPWYVYPKPDRIGVGVRDQFSDELKALDPIGLRPLGDAMASGYSWLEPGFAPAVFARGEESGLGFCWERLIVSPTKLSWMKEADVGADPKYAWWRRLREVDCSWVCSRGESERFLYYDGPTLLRCPVKFGMEGEQLVVRAATLAAGEVAFTQVSRTQLQDTRRGLFVRVHGGVASAQRIFVPVAVNERRGEWPRRPTGTPVVGRVEDTFLNILEMSGLRESEARGMLDCWRRPFFETEGTRVLMFLLERDYDAFCPMTMRPTPTETARVGVIWAELQ